MKTVHRYAVWEKKKDRQIIRLRERERERKRERERERENEREREGERDYYKMHDTKLLQEIIRKNYDKKLSPSILSGKKVMTYRDTAYLKTRAF